METAWGPAAMFELFHRCDGTALPGGIRVSTQVDGSRRELVLDEPGGDWGVVLVDVDRRSVRRMSTTRGEVTSLGLVRPDRWAWSD